jgi:hypothetical protein
MIPEEVREALKRQPFEPFRLVMSDGAGYEIRHPDLLWVGQWTAFVGLTGDAAKTLFERSVKVDLDHIVRLEPLEQMSKNLGNGSKGGKKK